jgi:hypothetical protein
MNLSSISSSFCKHVTLFQYVTTLFWDSGQNSFCPSYSSTYISVDNCMEKCFVTHMVLVYLLGKMKWHYFISDLKDSGYLLQYETPRSRINIFLYFIHIFYLDGCTSDFQYPLHFLLYFIIFAIFYSVQQWTGEVIHIYTKIKQKNKLRVLSPRKNYTDRATAAFRRS